MVFGSHVLDKSTQNHCYAISSSTRIMVQMYLGLVTSWMSIAKNLVAFEENNYKKEGQEIRIAKKLFMFLKVSFFMISIFLFFSSIWLELALESQQ